MNKKTGKISPMHDECKKEYDRIYYRNMSKEGKDRKFLLQKKRGNEIRKFSYDYLSKHKCLDCGETRIPTLDFDHKYDKNFNISDGIKNGYSLDRIKNEISKCDIRCANCHRIKTAKEFDWYNFDK